MTYTRAHPSPAYLEAVELGKEFQRTHKTFTGRHVFQSYPLLRQLIHDHGTKDILDYGCGKGEQLTYRNLRLLNKKGDTEKQVYPSWQDALGVDEIYMYDPCLPEYETLPTRQYGGVVCTDVMEHIPPQDTSDWVIREMMSFATQWVYASIALFPGKKTLADGSLAHKAIESLEWWVETWLTAAYDYPGIEWHIRLEQDVPPITHRYFTGKGEAWTEKEGWWQVWKPQQLEELTPKQRAELEMIARNQRVAVDPRAFGKKHE